MLGLAAIVEAVDFRNGEVSFRSSRKYRKGERLRIRLHLPPGSGKVYPVEVEVLELRAQDRTGNLYRTRVLGDLQGVEEFHGSDPMLRDKPRYSTNVRVRSPDLPGFRAMAVDLSNTGVQLEIEGPVSPGATMQLHFDLDGWKQPHLACPARVVWCRTDQESGRLRAGFQFLPVSAAGRQELVDLAEFIERRAESQLEELLELAKMLGPEQAPAPRAVATVAAPDASAPAESVAVAPPAALEAPPWEERRQAVRFLMLPLQARLEGYSRNLTAGSLFLHLESSEGVIQTLEFPECQLFHDWQTQECNLVRGLSSTQDSELLTQMRSRLPDGNWKHYQLVGPAHQVLLELVSRQCRPAGSR